MSSLSKRMKQTDIRTSLSHIKQTDRTLAEDASRPSDTVQDKVPKKEVPDEFSKDQQQEHKELQFRLNSETYSVGCDPSMTVLDALNKSPSFREETKKFKNKHKQVLLLRTLDQKPRAAVKTDFPCCLINSHEIIDVSFIKTDESASMEQTTGTKHTSLPSNPEEFVTFFVKKRGGDKLVHLLKSKALRAGVDYVCVYAEKEEKLRKALKRDGRFVNDMFQKHCALSEFGTENRHEMSKRVKHLDQKTFKVIVLSGPKQPESQEDFTSSVKTETDAAGTSQTPNTEQEAKQKKNTKKSIRSAPRWSAPKEIPDSAEILKLLRDQFQELQQQLKRRENLKNKSQVQNFFREEFAKSVENYLEVKKVRMLAIVSEAVCQIRVEGSPIGTGFILFDRFVLTNAHVIKPYMVDPSPMIHLQKALKTVFNFEDHQQKLREVSVNKEVFALAYGKDSNGRHLDYALLELEIDGLTNNTELLRRHSYSPPRAGSQICIVGHPGEGVKKVDTCFILKRESEQRSTNDPFHVITQQYLENVEENQIPYHSCFFNSSSGSPVFDEDCNLIGIHTGGYHPENNKNIKILEYAFSLEPILEDIEIQAEKKEENIRSKILSILKEHGNISRS